MTGTTLLGYAAATCTTLSLVPQVVRIVRTRSTQDISLGMYIVLNTGVFLWLVYGALNRDWPLVVANAVTLALTLTILVLKLRT